MIEIKGGGRVIVEDNMTSGKRLLSAEDVTDLRVKGNAAGVAFPDRQPMVLPKGKTSTDPDIAHKASPEDSSIAAKEESPLASPASPRKMIVNVVKTIALTVLVPLLVLYLGYRFGWS